jgi:hypothetical protein
VLCYFFNGFLSTYVETEIAGLTEEKILEQLHTVNKSGLYLTEKNFTDLLSGITYDTSLSS